MTEYYIDTSFGKIHFYRNGNGPKKLLLLHGSGGDNAMLSWQEVMRSFSDEYSVYAPDLLGYGRSSNYNGAVGAEFYRSHIDCLHELCRKLGLRSFALAGLSMGGAIAIGFALKYPEMVECLIPVASWGLSEKMPFHRFSWWYISKTDFTRLQFSLCGKSRLLTRWLLAYSLIGNRQLITDELVSQLMYACSRSRTAKAMQDFQRSSADAERAYPYYLPQLRELQMPVVFIIGEKDPLVPITDVQKACKALPGSKICIFECCKHWAVKEQPERFVSVVEEIETKDLR